ncbi:hypothetical protein CROQUDRAFT_653970 [Cronartium quercuum f. sp. fusiforme G11]|uniref:Uncharacterized protein n=1 Tax=Cronartium quercuum f. sp. fusiforme G11 TaxID=708437 RepID=A0A9P6TFW7_9BASI|nr:hypothetical protein CROQUDRAFT_653970 [Cronartium quercuum f. sp. fusiforme G11]
MEEPKQTTTDHERIKEEKFDPVEFNAQLDASLSQLYRTVESWIPAHLRSNLSNEPQPSSSKQFQSTHLRQPRLGLGATARPVGSLSNQELRKQLLSKNKGPTDHEEKEKVFEGEDEVEEEEESRTKTSFSSKNFKREDRFQVPSKSIPQMSNHKPVEVKAIGIIGTLSKRQIKKLRKQERLRIASQGEKNENQMDTEDSSVHTSCSTSNLSTPPDENPPNQQKDPQRSKKKRKKQHEIGVSSSSTLPTPQSTSSLSPTPENILSCHPHHQSDIKRNKKKRKKSKDITNVTDAIVSS